MLARSTGQQVLASVRCITQFTGFTSNYSSTSSSQQKLEPATKNCQYDASAIEESVIDVNQSRSHGLDENSGNNFSKSTSANINQAIKQNPIILPQESFKYAEKLSSLIKQKKEDQTYRVFRKVSRFRANFPRGLEDQRPVTIWCSNDYFGMSTHPKVEEAIRKALDTYGAGSGGTRNIAGNSPLHEKLEWELADLHEKEAALLFSSCFVANESTLLTLSQLIPGCHIFSDAGNHASMIYGIRNSGVPKHVFRKFDASDLESQLSQLPVSTPKIVAFETVHSMTGDISNVELMCDIAHRYGALTFVDEVHAVGLYGHRGAGVAQRDGCMHKIDIVSGTLGKAFGNFGGYIASTNNIVDVVRSFAAGFIFTTSLPPTVVCGATESVRVLKGPEGKKLRETQAANVQYMKDSLMNAGIAHCDSGSHIIPIPVYEASKCTKVSSDLIDRGHYIQSINYPTVARGTERLRVSISPFHDPRMIDSFMVVLKSVWRDNGLPFHDPQHTKVDLD